MYQWILNKENFAYCRLDYHNTSNTKGAIYCRVVCM